MSARPERYAVVAALVVLAVAGLGALLGGLGLWRPWLVLPLIVAVALGAVRLTRGLPRIPLDRVSIVSLVMVTALTALGYGATHAEQVLPRRDAGSNLQAAVSLALTGSRVVAVDPAAIGAPASVEVPGVTLASPAFYAVGPVEDPAIQPQFPVGPAAVLSLGVWAGEVAGGLTPAFLPAPLAMAFAVLAIGLLAATALGGRAGPVVAAAVALTFPVLHTGRSTYSEPFAALTLAAGLLCLALAARDRSPRAALLAGVLVGGTTLIRIDALREVFLVALVAGLYALRTAPWTRHLLVGLAGSTGLGLLAAAVLSPRYLADISGSFVPLVAGGLLACGATAGLFVLGARGRSPVGPSWLPHATGAAVVLVGLGLATRPLWQVVRQSPDDPGSRVVAGLQLRQGLPVDGGRTYAERTVEWLSWWVGPIALGIALVVLAAAVSTATRRWQRGDPPPWAGPLLVAAASTALTLWRPAITPDHPWAERRLVIAVALVAVLVVAAAAWLVDRPWPSPLRLTAAAAVIVALFAPTVAASWPHLGDRVEQGSPAAVDEACTAFAEGDVALMVDARAANEWPQVLRGRCGVPALSTTAGLRADATALAGAVEQVRTAVEAQGHRLVLVAAESPETIVELTGAEPTVAVDRTVLEDDRLLERRPDSLVPLRIALWTSSVQP
ncbi:hypothetical protein GA707_17070 [Nostocoides sp. F2B08]|uniref:hypothetical protein n=1 Tax=Nostocoides sp. F2B08 TaxID=2653936 RepID=UPI0012630C21|nr:hypothetical protein [Tetrasphaera sp. F2B08]KAB7741915.1 hypothetical protein GA707_17070 [Tetrasphaera sp. F2B08]